MTRIKINQERDLSKVTLQVGSNAGIHTQSRLQSEALLTDPFLDLFLYTTFFFFF